MVVQIRNNSDDGWQSAKTIKIRNNANNGWHTVNTGKIWTGSGWNTFYTRLNKVTPSVSSTETITYSEIRFLVTQGNEAQYADFPATVEALITKPGTVEYSQIRTDRIAEFAVTGLSQNQIVTMKYRLNYGDNEYFPEDQSYLTTNKTTTVITKVSPTITFVGSSGYTGLTFQVDGGNANSVSYQLQTTAGVDEAGKSGTITAANYNSDFTISGLGAGTVHRLRAYGNYTSNFDPDETSSSTLSGTANVDIQNAVPPTITFVSSTTSAITWTINLHGADSGTYSVVSITGGNNVVNNAAAPANGNITASGLYADESYRCEVTAFWSNANVDQTTATRTNSTDDFGAITNPSIAINSGATNAGRSVAELMFTLSGGNGVGSIYHLDNINGQVASGSTTGSSVNVGGLDHNTAYTLYVQKYDNRYRSTRYSGSYNSAGNTTRPASSPSSYGLGGQTMTNTSGSSTLLARFSGYGTGLPDGARRYYYRATSSAGAGATFVSSAVVTNPTTSVSVTVTRIFYYQARWEQTYESIITGTAKAFGSNSTCGVAMLVCSSSSGLPAYLLATNLV